MIIRINQCIHKSLLLHAGEEFRVEEGILGHLVLLVEHVHGSHHCVEQPEGQHDRDPDIGLSDSELGCGLGHTLSYRVGVYSGADRGAVLVQEQRLINSHGV